MSDRDLKPDNSTDVLVPAASLMMSCPSCGALIAIRARRASLWIRHAGDACLGSMAWAGTGRLP